VQSLSPAELDSRLAAIGRDFLAVGAQLVIPSVIQLPERIGELLDVNL
jgi:hypothetical protein